MRALLRRLVLPLIALVLVALVAGAVLGVGFVRRPFPQATGEIVINGLSGPVEVLRDERGVPHIYADTSEDLFMAQGYVAAQDRFFQMDLRRHVTSGRLSELVGPDGLEADKVIRTMGWRKVAEAELAQLDPATRTYLRAYTDGVNAYLQDNSARSQVALEYMVLGQSVPDYTIEPWTEADSVAWLKAMAWDLRGNYGDELARAQLVGSISLAQMNALYPDYPFDRHATILSETDWEPSPGSANPLDAPPQPDAGTGDELDAEDLAVSGAGSRAGDPSGDYAGDDPGPAGNGTAGSGTVESDPSEIRADELASAPMVSALAAMDAVPNTIGGVDGVGSNAWAVGGEHTESGMPLLANDPHLGVTQPGIWHQVGLHCRTVSEECEFDVTGFSFAGFPGVVIGQNQDIAWGFTNLDPDVTDFYLEEVEGTTYRRDDEWVPLETRTETIVVAGGEDEEITIRETVHGPIMSDVLDDVQDVGLNAPINAVQTSQTYEVSLAWTALEETRTADAVFVMNAAENWDEFREAAKLFAAPSQNLLYADNEGNIGYQAPGLVPIRPASTTNAPPGYWPTPGWRSEYDWQGWVPFEEMPHALNPESGVIVTANQAVSSYSAPFLTTEWDHGYRGQRILDLINEGIDRTGGNLTVADMEAIQNDDYNLFAETLLPWLLAVDFDDDPFHNEAKQLLAEWDLTSPTTGDNAAAAIYYNAVWARILDLTFGDQMPGDLYPSGNSRWMTAVTMLLDDHDHEWWDDRSTVGIVETRDEILRQAMIEARLDLTRLISKDPSDWEWGRLHRVTFKHEVLGGDGIPGPVRALFNHGPYQAPGGSALVNAMNWDAGTGGYDVVSAPSMRMVVDLGNRDGSTWVNQTGNSGHVFHRNSTDQTETWVEGGSYPWAVGEDAVRASTRDKLMFLPEEPSD